MIFKQFQHEEGACLSYVLGCTAKRVCAVVEPQLDIVVYCHTGSRSQQAVEFLYESGFKSAKSLVGGIEAWAQKIDPSMPRY
jgi:rhodanese-related sulfurtransferase